jgi:hypothetical protein
VSLDEGHRASKAVHLFVMTLFDCSLVIRTRLFCRPPLRERGALPKQQQDGPYRWVLLLRVRAHEEGHLKR